MLPLNLVLRLENASATIVLLASIVKSSVVLLIALLQVHVCPVEHVVATQAMSVHRAKPSSCVPTIVLRITVLVTWLKESWSPFTTRTRTLVKELAAALPVGRVPLATISVVPATATAVEHVTKVCAFAMMVILASSAKLLAPTSARAMVNVFLDRASATLVGKVITVAKWLLVPETVPL